MEDNIKKVKSTTSKEDKFEDILIQVKTHLEKKANFHEITVSGKTVKLVQSSIADLIIEYSNSDDVEGSVDYWVDVFWEDLFFVDKTQGFEVTKISYAMGRVSDESREIKELIRKDFHSFYDDEPPEQPYYFSER